MYVRIPKAAVSLMQAIGPDDDFRAATMEAAKDAKARISVVPGAGEKLPFGNATFDAISASQVLCAVTSPSKTLEDFKRVFPARIIELPMRGCDKIRHGRNAAPTNPLPLPE